MPKREDLKTVWRFRDEAVVQIVPNPYEVHAADPEQLRTSSATADVGLKSQQ